MSGRVFSTSYTTEWDAGEGTLGLSAGDFASDARIEVLSLPESGEIRLDGRAIELGEMLSADEVARLSYDPGAIFDADAGALTLRARSSEGNDLHTVNITETDPDNRFRIVPTETSESAHLPDEYAIFDSITRHPFQYGAAGEPVTLTYSFPQMAAVLGEVDGQFSVTGEEILDGFAPFQARAQEAVRSIFAQLSSVANINFVEVTGDDAAKADLKFASTSALDETHVLGFARLPPFQPSDTDPNRGRIVIRTELFDELEQGQSGYAVLIHEILHAAIGLHHPEDYIFPSQADSNLFTVITESLGGGLFPTTAQLLDILALQASHGMSEGRETGDNIYRYESLSVGNFYSESGIFTIHDTGGDDTLDLSNQRYPASIDLRPGGLSALTYLSPSGEKTSGAFVTTPGTVIENAVGTSLDDVILGNSADNRLQGLGGNDEIKGGEGLDTAVYDGAFADYSFQRLQNILLVTDRESGETDKIYSDIEQLEFADGATVGFAAAGIGDGTPNEGPVTRPDLRVISSGETRIPLFDLLQNDSDPNGDPLQITGISTDTEGVRARIEGDDLVLTISPDAQDRISLSYIVSDDRGGESAGDLTLFKTALPHRVTDSLPDLPFGLSNATRLPPQISSDGSVVTVAADTGIYQVRYAEDGGVTTIKIEPAGSLTAAGGLENIRVNSSDNGRFVLLYAERRDFGSSDQGLTTLQLFDFETGETRTVLDEPTNFIADVFISDDGRSILYTAPSDNTRRALHLLDPETGEAEVLVELGNNNGARIVDVSKDGRYVLLRTDVPLLESDTNNINDLYILDRASGTFTLASPRLEIHDDETHAQFFLGNRASISDDGQHVVFDSLETGFVNEETHGQSGQTQIFHFDVQSNAVTLLSKPALFDSAYRPSISEDGRYVLFDAFPNPDLPQPEGGRGREVIVLDQQTGEFARVDLDEQGLALSGGRLALSSDGTTIVFNHRIVEDSLALEAIRVANPLIDGGARATVMDDLIRLPESGRPLTISVDELLVNDVAGSDEFELKIIAVGNADGGSVRLEGDTIIFDRDTPDRQRISFDYVVEGGAGAYSIGTAATYNNLRVSSFVPGIEDLIEGMGGDLRINLGVFGGRPRVHDFELRYEIIAVDPDNDVTADFVETTGSILIKAGRPIPEINLQPIADGLAEGVEEFTLIVKPGPDAPQDLSFSFSRRSFFLADDAYGNGINQGSTSFDMRFVNDILGSAGDDVLETIDARPNRFIIDELIADGGYADRLRGLDGDDVVRGYVGNDVLYGDAGNDTLEGGDHDDRLYGGTGDDTLYGGQHDDHLEGALGDDSLYGGDHDDHLYGGAGADALFGGYGDDRLKGDDGEDALFGGYGDDILDGGAGADALFGEDGSDWIKVGAGDTADGGAHGDTLIILSGDVVHVDGGAGTDRIRPDHDSFDFDFNGLLTSGRVENVELVDLEGAGAQALRLSAADVETLTDANNRLRIYGNDEDSVDLIGFDEVGTTIVDGEAYTLFEAAGGITVLLDNDLF